MYMRKDVMGLWGLVVRVNKPIDRLRDSANFELWSHRPQAK
jgi:hypothetical protein